MLPSRYSGPLLLACSMLFGSIQALGQNAAADDPMRACVTVLSNGLESGMTTEDYPDQARQDGRTGTAQVQFSVSHTGKMEHASLAQGSGEPDLDQAAVSAAQRIFPANSLAPAPCRLGYGFTVTLSVIYKLLQPQ